jgi:hypothetical protein
MKEIAWRLVAIERQKNFGHNESMLQDGLTAAQRLAIQKLIRAKSDREIALCCEGRAERIWEWFCLVARGCA